MKRWLENLQISTYRSYQEASCLPRPNACRGELRWGFKITELYHEVRSSPNSQSSQNVGTLSEKIINIYLILNANFDKIILLKRYHCSIIRSKNLRIKESHFLLLIDIHKPSWKKKSPIKNYMPPEEIQLPCSAGYFIFWMFTILFFIIKTSQRF